MIVMRTDCCAEGRCGRSRCMYAARSMRVLLIHSSMILGVLMLPLFRRWLWQTWMLR